MREVTACPPLLIATADGIPGFPGRASVALPRVDGDVHVSRPGAARIQSCVSEPLAERRERS